MRNEPPWRRWVRVFRQDTMPEIDEELRHHTEQRVRDYVDGGMDPESARRAALERLGDLTHVRQQCARQLSAERRAESRRRALYVSWLDLKLGVRMLAKYPWLSLVSVIGMAVTTAIGAGGFGLVHSIVDAPLPLDEGDRVVSLQNADARKPGSQDQQTVHDFVHWRDQLTSVQDLAAFTTDRLSLFIPGWGVERVRVAQMTASGFRVARVAPALGRPLLNADEQPVAPPVVVIAHEEWERRFDGDPGVIGRPIRLGGGVHTVVGVMPEGFRFPVNHRYWVSLRLDPAAHEVGGAPAITIFGRLADGATVEQAQAELTTIGQRMAATYPETHEDLRPWILPYTHALVGIDTPARMWLIRTFQVALSLLLVVVSVNVAVLIYARTAARTSEIAVRTALGASRSRVVMQLFAEALVLSSLAAAVGLTIATLGFDVLQELVSEGNADQLPFWLNIGLSPTLVVYVVGLAVLAAGIVGVLPALRATGDRVQGSLKQISSGSSRMQLGRTWTTLIVVQVAVAVAVLPYAIWGGGRFVRNAYAESDYPIDEILRASLSVEGEGAPATSDSADEAVMATRLASSVSEIVRRLGAESEVAAVSFASHYPGRGADWRSMEVEGVPTRRWGHANQVGIDLFAVLEVPILAGRGFVASDAARGSNAVIVNRMFVEEFLAGHSVVGHHVRQWVERQDGSGERDPGPWMEIVGVVPEFTAPAPFGQVNPMVYEPLALADAAGSIRLAVRMRPGTAPAAFLGRAREIAHSVNPALPLEVQAAAESERLQRKGFFALALLVVAVAGSALLLSAAGIYAMMSFTVASRRREIGIRAALGATPRRVLGGIFRRTIAQLGAGVLIGLLLAEAVPRVQGGSFFAGEGVRMLPVVAAIMLAVGLLAALSPARRGLSVDPAEALRED